MWRSRYSWLFPITLASDHIEAGHALRITCSHGVPLEPGEKFEAIVQTGPLAVVSEFLPEQKVSAAVTQVLGELGMDQDGAPHHMMYNGKVLVNGKTMLASGLREHASTHLVQECARDFDLTIFYQGGELAIDAFSQMTLGELKELIRDARGLDLDEQVLVFQGAQLKDGDAKTLFKLGIGPDNNFLTLFPKVN